MYKKVVVFILVLLAVFTSLGVIVWGFDKGFDITDGGCVVLRYQQNQPNEPSDYWYEHILVKTIIPVQLRSVKSLRYLGFCLNLFASLLFTWAVYRAYQRIHKHNILFSVLTICMLAGFVVSYAGMPSELTYNSLNQFFLISATAFLMLGYLTERPGFDALYIIAGILGGVLYAIKLPTAIVFSLIGLVITLAKPANGKRSAVIFFISTGTTMILLNYILEPGFMEHYYKAFYEWHKYESIHNVGMLTDKLVEIGSIITIVTLLAIPISTCFWLSKRIKNPIVSFIPLSAGIFMITLFFVRQWVRVIDGEAPGSHYYMMGIALLCMSLLLRPLSLRGSILQRFKSIRHNSAYMPLFMFLALIPYIGALGSAVSWDTISKYYFITFLGVIALISGYHHKRPTHISLVFFSVFALIAGLYVYVQHPFGYGPLYKQTIPFKGIKYDPEQVQFLKTTQNILTQNGFDPQQGIIVAYTAPGLVYLMDSYHPGGILWKSKRQSNYFRNLKKTQLRMKPVIITLHYNPTEKFISGFNDATGMSFADTYHLVGVYKSCDSISKAHIYFPNSKSID